MSSFDAAVLALYTAFENDLLYGNRKPGDPVPRGLLPSAAYSNASATVQTREEARRDSVVRERAAWNADVDLRKMMQKG